MEAREELYWKTHADYKRNREHDRKSWSFQIRINSVLIEPKHLENKKRQQHKQNVHKQPFQLIAHLISPPYQMFTKLSEKVHKIYTFLDSIIQISEKGFRDIHH